MIELAILTLFLLAMAIGFVVLRKKRVKWGDGEIAPLATIDRQIARFEADLAAAETQEQADVAQGRLNYWMKEKRRA